MALKIIPVLALLIVAACSHHPAECRGHAFAFNPDKWTPTPADLGKDP